MLNPFDDVSVDEVYALRMHKSQNFGQNSYEELSEFLQFLKSRFIFLDPYRKRLINPFNGKEYNPRKTFFEYKYNKENLLNKLSYNKPSMIVYKEFLNRRYIKELNLDKAYDLLPIVDIILYVLAVISMILIGLYSNLFLGLSVGFFLLFLPIGFQTIEGVIGEAIDGLGATTLSYMRNSLTYKTITITLILLSLIFTCIYSKSLIIPILSYSYFYYYLFPTLVRLFLSRVRYDKHITDRMKDLFEDIPE